MNKLAPVICCNNYRKNRTKYKDEELRANNKEPYKQICANYLIHFCSLVKNGYGFLVTQRGAQGEKWGGHITSHFLIRPT